MIRHTIVFLGNSGVFEDFYPDIANNKITHPAGDVRKIIPINYEYRRISEIKIVFQYDSPVQDIEWLSKIDMAKYKVKDVFCCFSEESQDDLYLCVYLGGCRFLGELSKKTPSIFNNLQNYT